MRPGGFASKGHVPARAAKQVGAAAAADFCSVSASQPKQREKLKRERERGECIPSDCQIQSPL